MKHKWKLTGESLSRTLQALAAAGGTLLLALAASTAEGPYAAAVSQPKEAAEMTGAGLTSEPASESTSETDASGLKVEISSENFTEPVSEAVSGPGTETLTTETSATEIPATETPVTEAPVTEAPAAETPVTEAPPADGNTSAELPADGHIPGAPVQVQPPYADTSTTAREEELRSIVQFQPVYLDVDRISLSWTHLEEELNALTESWSGEWSIYLKDLKTGDVISVNPHPMESASLIKLFIMGAVMEQIHDGTLEETDTIDRLLEDMITVSDNTAANELVRYLSDDHDHEDGLKAVNDFAKRHGFSDTVQVNGLEDPQLWHVQDGRNETSPRDCAELMAQIYDGTLVSHMLSRQMEDYLLAQEYTYKIPSPLPEEAVTANKTGEISDAENDCAIVCSPGGDYVLCVMSAKWDSKNTAITRIREISRLVYDHFNPSDVQEYIDLSDAGSVEYCFSEPGDRQFKIVEAAEPVVMYQVQAEPSGEAYRIEVEPSDTAYRIQAEPS